MRRCKGLIDGGMKISLFIFLFLVQLNAIGQSVMDKTVNESCICITESKEEVFDYDSYLNLIMQCASPSIMQNSEKLQRELGIEDKDELEAIEEIGSKVGERLVMECPRFAEITIKVMGEDPELMEEVMDELNEDSEDSEMIDAGTIVSISKEIPCQISLKNDQGETLNYLWLEPISIDDQYLANPDGLKGKKVSLVYYFSEIYDAKSGSYQTRKILIELNIQ